MLQAFRSISVWQFCAAFAFSLLAACAPSHNNSAYQLETLHGTATLSPIQQTKHLFTSNQATSKMHYHVDASNTIDEPIDILILFDRTMSMKNEIRATADAAKEIVDNIHESAPNTRFAVAAVSDYSPMFTTADDTNTWLLMTDFTLNGNEVESATNAIKLSNGGDMPEAYSRGLYEASKLNWREDAEKIIIFFGDAVDHQIDPGRDEIMGTTDDLNMDMVLDIIKQSDIAIIGIYTSEKDKVKALFNHMSDYTAGQPISLDNASSSATVIIDSIKQALRQPIMLSATGSYQSWINIDANEIGLHDTSFAINVTPPENTPAGVYEIPFTFSTRDAISNQQSINPDILITVITGWYNHPIVLWLPLILLLLLLLANAWRMLSGNYNRAYHVSSSFGYDTERYSLLHLIIDLLVLMSIVCSATAIYLCLNSLVLSQIL